MSKSTQPPSGADAVESIPAPAATIPPATTLVSLHNYNSVSRKLQRAMTRTSVRVVLGATMLIAAGVYFFGHGSHRHLDSFDTYEYQSHPANQSPGRLRDDDSLRRGAHGLSSPGMLPNLQKPIYDIINQQYVDLEEDMPYTTFSGGTNGYSVFDNLYLSGGVLLAVTPDGAGARAIPSPRAIMSAAKTSTGAHPAAGEDRWNVIASEEMARLELGNTAVRLPGVTYLFNDPPGPEGYLIHFEHFVTESFVPAARAVASVAEKKSERLEDQVPQRIMFPRCGTEPSWRDNKGLNVWLLSRVLPGMPVEDANQWLDRAASDLPVILDRVVIVDRWAAHSSQGRNGKWGKMNAHTPDELVVKGDFFAPFRDNMIAAIGDAMPDVGKHGLPVVTFMSKKNKPHLDAKSEEGLIAELRKLTDVAEVHIANVKSMTHRQRVSLISQTDILIGLHGNELLDATWMRAGSAVIELFEQGGFVRDYGIFFDLLNLDHTSIQKDRVMSEDIWRDHDRVRGPTKDHEIEIDPEVVARIVKEKLNAGIGKH